MYSTINIEPTKVTEMWENHFTSNISLSDMTQHHGTSPALVYSRMTPSNKRVSFDLLHGASPNDAFTNLHKNRNTYALASHVHHKRHMYITCIHMYQLYPWPDFIKPNLCALLWAQKFLLSESQGDHNYKLPRCVQQHLHQVWSLQYEALCTFKKYIWCGCPKQSSHFNVMFFLRKALLISPIPAATGAAVVVSQIPSKGIFSIQLSC